MRCMEWRVEVSGYAGLGRRHPSSRAPTGELAFQFGVELAAYGEHQRVFVLCVCDVDGHGGYFFLGDLREVSFDGQMPVKPEGRKASLAKV